MTRQFTKVPLAPENERIAEKVRLSFDFRMAPATEVELARWGVGRMRRPRGFGEPGRWCGREDLNLHTLSGTCTSSMRVCQFRHDRKINMRCHTS